MTTKSVRIGSLDNIHEYDDTDWDGGIETDDTIKVNQAPVAGVDVLRLADLPTIGNIVTASAVIGDDRVVRGDGGARGIQSSDVTLLDGGYLGIGVAAPTAALHLKAGTAAASTGPLKFTAGALLATPETGVLEFYGGKLYITNLLHQRVIDRTSDVAVATVTVSNTNVETLLWLGHMAANSLSAGNMFKFHCDGVVENGGPTAADRVTIRIRVGGIAGAVVATLSPIAGAIAAGTIWHLDANACQRTIGAANPRAVHIHLILGTTIVDVTAVSNIDTTANMDVAITAQWASADVANIISLYQGFMEYKN